MLDPQTVIKRAITIRRMLARYRETLEQSKAGLKDTVERLGRAQVEEDEPDWLDTTADILIEAYQTEIEQVTEAITWMEDTNVEKGKGTETETGLGVEFAGVKINVAR